MTIPVLSAAELAAFREQGFLVVRGLASHDTVAELLAVGRDHVRRAVEPIEYEADTAYPGAPAHRGAEGGHTARRLRQVYARDAAFRRWALGAAVTERVKLLLDSPRVALTQAHHNSLMTKQPSYSSITHWHRDIRYWSFERNDLVSVWLALGREHRDNGCLGFLPGSHTLELNPEHFEHRAFLRPDLPENRALIERAVYPELDAGDVVFFHAMTFHAAGWNRTDETKYSLVFSYHRQDNQPLPGSRSAEIESVKAS